MNIQIPILKPHNNIPFKDELIEYFDKLNFIHSVYIRGSIATQQFIDGISDYDLIILVKRKIDDLENTKINKTIKIIIKKYILDLLILPVNFTFNFNMKLKLKCSSFCIYNIENDITKNIKFFTLKDIHENFKKYVNIKILNAYNCITDITDKQFYIYCLIHNSKLIIRYLYIKYLPEIKQWLLSCKIMSQKLYNVNLTNKEIIYLDKACSILSTRNL